MASTYKAIAMMAELKNVLKVRLSTLAQVESFDASGNPCVKIGAAAGGATGAFIRIKPVESLQQDIVGHSQQVFCPHVVQLALEAEDAPGAGAEVNPWSTLLPIVGELALRGLKIEVWIEDAGTAPAVTTFDTAAKKKAEFEPHANYPLVIGQ